MPEILTSTSFLEKIIFLILTAIFTGILVPYISARINDRKFREQKLFEAEIARQNKIIDSQNELLIQIEKLAHLFQQRIISVAWYKVGEPNSDRFEKSRNAYEETHWEFETELRTAIGKAHRLLSLDALKQLEIFHDYVEKLDIRLIKLVKHNKPDEEWDKFIAEIKFYYHNYLRDLIDTLAKDCGLLRMENRVDSTRLKLDE